MPTCPSCGRENPAGSRQAVDYIDRSDEVNHHGLQRLSLAEVLALAKRDDERAAMLDEALARFEQKGNSVMAGRARAQLDELGAASSA